MHLLGAEFAQVYFKEGTSERCQSRYRMDRLLETLMLVNGQEWDADCWEVFAAGNLIYFDSIVT